MKRKKGWLRIIEAFIAVLIVTSVLTILVTRQQRQQNEVQQIYEMQRNILKQISLNETLRSEILQEKKDSTENFIREVLPFYWNFTIKICEVSEFCGMPFSVDKDVYADEILITSNLTYYNPRKLKFFIWEK